MEPAFNAVMSVCFAKVNDKLKKPADRRSFGSTCKVARAAAFLNKASARVAADQIDALVHAAERMPRLRRVVVRCGGQQGDLVPAAVRRLAGIPCLAALRLEAANRTVVALDALSALSGLPNLRNLELANWLNLGQGYVDSLAALQQVVSITVQMSPFPPAGDTLNGKPLPPAGTLSALRITQLGTASYPNFLRGGAAQIHNIVRLLALDVSKCDLNRELATTRLFGGDGLRHLARLNISLDPRMQGHLSLLSTARLPSLRDLTARGCKLLCSDAEVLSQQLPALTRLDVGSNMVNAAGAAAIAQLQQLQYLDVARNHLGGAGVSALAALTSLTRLHARETQADSAAARALATGLTRLRYLDLAQCGSISNACKADLRNILRMRQCVLQLE